MICAPPLAPMIFALLLSAAPDNQRMDPRETEARKECLAGRYQTGAELLAQLFAETANPNYVFNQARCFQQNGKFDEAILRFQEYLRIGKDLSADAKAEADRHLAECQAARVRGDVGSLGASADHGAPSAGADATGALFPVGVPPSSISEQVEPSPVPSVVAKSAQTGSEPRTGGSGLRTAGIVIGACGVAAAASGVIFSVETKNVQNEVTSDNDRRSFDRKKYDNGKLYSELQWVGYGVGGAAILGGAVLYFLGARETSPTKDSISVAPAVSTHLVSLTLQGSY